MVNDDPARIWDAAAPAATTSTSAAAHRSAANRDRRFTVPEKVWKVILVLPREDSEPRKYSRTIAVILPNDQSVDFDWAKYRVSVCEVEKLTGYTFFRRCRSRGRDQAGPVHNEGQDAQDEGNAMKKHPVVAALEEAVKGLVYVSETEAELEPVFWDSESVGADEFLKAAGAKKGTKIEETTLDSFFRTVSTEDKPTFAKLAKVLKNDLMGTEVFKIGSEAEKVVIVVGKTNDGKCAGVKTTVVET